MTGADCSRYEARISISQHQKAIGTIAVPMYRRTMNRQQVLDLYFMDARCKLIELAAFLDRVDRATGDSDFRLDAFRDALRHLSASEPQRAENVMQTLSDPTTEPVAVAPGKSAAGAWPGDPLTRTAAPTL